VKKSNDQVRIADLQQFEGKIHYVFDNIELLDQALSHSSYVREKRHEGLHDNERLEFLGDAFFDAIIGENLYRMFPSAEEGSLSKMRASIVCEESLAAVARRLQLADYLLLGYGEEKNGGRDRDSILADATEAVVGAIYLDSGYEQAKKFVEFAFAKELEDARDGRFRIRDYKSALQEKLQATGITDIKYILEKEEGPDHAKTFTIRLEVTGKAVGHGTGKSKKTAEQEAAKDALERGIDAF
jgi:ribonuclease-3